MKAMTYAIKDTGEVIVLSCEVLLESAIFTREGINIAEGRSDSFNH